MKFERGHRRDEDVDIDVKILAEDTLRILIHDGDIETWLPKSELIGFDWDEDYVDQDMIITIPEWLGIEGGLI